MFNQRNDRRMTEALRRNMEDTDILYEQRILEDRRKICEEALCLAAGICVCGEEVTKNEDCA